MRFIYFSFLGPIISILQNLFSIFHKPFMVYGFFDRSIFNYKRSVRISSTAKLMNKSKIKIEDGVWIWHYSIVDGSNGITIKEGSQIGAWVGLFTHSSHVSIRLYGKEYIKIPSNVRKGYVRKSIEIGEYCFVGAGSYILPGVKLGKGCIVSAGSVVTKNAPEYSILSGNPAEVIGSSYNLDRRFLKDENLRKTYFDKLKINENF